MQQSRKEPALLRRAILHHQHRILNRHEPVVRSVDQKQPAARLVHDAQLNEREVLLRLVEELVFRRVAELLAQRRQRRPWVLVVFGFLQPLTREEMVRAGALADGAEEAGRVRVGGADGVVAAGGEAPLG